MRPWWQPAPTRLLVLGVVSCSLAIVSLVAPRWLLPPDGTLPGLRVDGAEVAASLDQLVHARAEALTSRRVEIFCDGASLGAVSLADLGVRVDEARIVRATRAELEAPDLLTRWEQSRRAARGEIDVPLEATIDASVALPLLTRLKEVIDRAPTPARLDLDHHGVTPEADGRYVDAYGALDALARMVRAKHDDGAELRFDVPMASLPPRVTSAFVRSLDVHAVLSSYETYFSRGGDQARRAENIDVAAQKLDGLVLFPGELVSFNRVVGERSEENGFKKSWEIFKGEMQEGVGGGTCQVASTLHAAAFFGGLDILERLPHSRPSAYIPIGLDATVVYPVVDMKLKNPYPFPVVLHAKVEGNRVRMELLGQERPARIAFSRELLRTYAYARKIDEKEGLAAHHVVLKQHGIKGFRVKRKRTFTFADGRTREESTTDLYPPTSEVYEVPPGFDTSLLPPLPTDDVGEDLEHAPPDEGADSSTAPAIASATPAPSASPPASAAPVASAATASAAPSSAPATPSDVVVEIGRGVHEPTSLQSNPPRTLTIKR